MKKEENYEMLDLLDTVQKVDVSPFLFTRIQQKIENNYGFKLSGKMAWSLSICLAFVIALNITFMVNRNQHNNKSVNLAESMDLMPHNSLYR